MIGSVQRIIKKIPFFPLSFLCVRGPQSKRGLSRIVHTRGSWVPTGGGRGAQKERERRTNERLPPRDRQRRPRIVRSIKVAHTYKHRYIPVKQPRGRWGNDEEKVGPKETENRGPTAEKAA